MPNASPRWDAKPAAARSSASSQLAGRNPPPSLTSGSVSRTCLAVRRPRIGVSFRFPQIATDLRYDPLTTGESRQDDQIRVVYTVHQLGAGRGLRQFGRREGVTMSTGPAARRRAHVADR